MKKQKTNRKTFWVSKSQIFYDCLFILNCLCLISIYISEHKTKLEAWVLRSPTLPWTMMRCWSISVSLELLRGMTQGCTKCGSLVVGLAAKLKSGRQFPAGLQAQPANSQDQGSPSLAGHSTNWGSHSLAEQRAQPAILMEWGSPHAKISQQRTIYILTQPNKDCQVQRAQPEIIINQQESSSESWFYIWLHIISQPIYGLLPSKNHFVQPWMTIHDQVQVSDISLCSRVQYWLFRNTCLL